MLRLNANDLRDEYRALHEDKKPLFWNEHMDSFEYKPSWGSGLLTAGALVAGGGAYLLWTARVQPNPRPSTAFWILPTGNGILVGGIF